MMVSNNNDNINELVEFMEKDKIKSIFLYLTFYR